MTRNSQIDDQKRRNVSDVGMRSAVTGGKHMDGFAQLFRKISIDVGIPDNYIYHRNSPLPGFFRPTKKWDFLIIRQRTACDIFLPIVSNSTLTGRV